MFFDFSTPPAFSHKVINMGILHPEGFHGANKKSPFFEGWYIKLVDPTRKQRWAVIPGIFRGIPGEAGIRDEAFVQVLDGTTGRSWFHTFPLDQFTASSSTFDVRVGENHFTSTGVSLRLPQLTGDVAYTSSLEPWPVTLAAPGIMGWYGLVPFMECYHGIVSFGHGLSGQLDVEGKPIDFSNGRGYIEKDWGRSFPSGYVWLHSNHFASEVDASFIGSVALIPWMGSRFRGFIAGLRHDGRLFRWTTYNRTKESGLVIDDTHVSWSLSGPDGTLTVRADRTRGGLLHAPLRSEPHQRVEETLDARIHVTHTSPTGEVLFDDVGDVGAMEVFGDIEKLLGTKPK
jgi:hypothetical protein